MVTVDARDLNRLIAATGNLGDARLSPLTADLAAETVKQTQRRFDRRTAPDGTRWKPRKDNLPHPLLEKSGRLRRSIGERDLQEKEAEIGTSGVVYAGVHQHGSDRIPQRQFLGWSTEDRADLVTTADDWMERYVGRVLR